MNRRVINRTIKASSVQRKEEEKLTILLVTRFRKTVQTKGWNSGRRRSLVYRVMKLMTNIYIVQLCFFQNNLIWNAQPGKISRMLSRSPDNVFSIQYSKVWTTKHLTYLWYEKWKLIKMPSTCEKAPKYTYGSHLILFLFVYLRRISNILFNKYLTNENVLNFLHLISLILLYDGMFEMWKLHCAFHLKLFVIYWPSFLFCLHSVICCLVAFDVQRCFSFCGAISCEKWLC